jgi:hypothetical protein
MLLKHIISIHLYLAVCEILSQNSNFDSESQLFDIVSLKEGEKSDCFTLLATFWVHQNQNN